MKEIYLAKDVDGEICGFDNVPTLSEGIWCKPLDDEDWYNFAQIRQMGIDVTAFKLTHEKPIKIRAEWEVVR